MKAKSSANDYEEYSMWNAYDVITSAHTPNPYEEPANSPTSSTEDNTLHTGENEPIYEDPGHVKESIYEWFEQKKMFKLNVKTIRCIVIYTNSCVC